MCNKGRVTKHYTSMQPNLLNAKVKSGGFIRISEEWCLYEKFVRSTQLAYTLLLSQNVTFLIIISDEGKCKFYFGFDTTK